MDKNFIVGTRVVGAFFILMAAVCFVAVLGFIDQNIGSLNTTQLIFTAGFWLGILGFYGNFVYFSIKNRPYNSYRGNRKMLVPALLLLAFSTLSIYYQFIVIGHTSWYKTITLVAGWVTFGLFAFFLIVFSLVRIAFARKGKKL